MIRPQTSRHGITFVHPHETPEHKRENNRLNSIISKDATIMESEINYKYLNRVVWIPSWKRGRRMYLRGVSNELKVVQET